MHDRVINVTRESSFKYISASLENMPVLFDNLRDRKSMFFFYFLFFLNLYSWFHDLKGFLRICFAACLENEINHCKQQQYYFQIAFLKIRKCHFVCLKSMHPHLVMLRTMFLQQRYIFGSSLVIQSLMSYRGDYKQSGRDKQTHGQTKVPAKMEFW